MTRPAAGPRRSAGERTDTIVAGALPRRPPSRRPPRPKAAPHQADHERVRDVVRSARRALLRAASEAELLAAICRIATDEAGYRLAWVGFADDDPDQTVRPVAQAGSEEGLLGMIAVTWADTPLGRGPTGTAIRTGDPAVGRDFRTDPGLAPWREQAIQHGYASSLALPLRADDRTFGALTICATAPDAFSADDVDLLAGLADDLAFGIALLRTRAARETAEAQLGRSEHDLAEAQRIARIGSWTLDPLTGDATWSSEMYHILGLDPDGPALGLADISRVFTPESVSRVAAAVERAVQAGAPWDMDLELARPDGAPGWVASRGIAERDDAGAVVTIRGTMQDITERAALEAQRTRLARLLDEVSSEIYVLDAETLRFSGANAGALRNLGYSLEELSELTPLDLKHEHTLASFTALLAPLRTGAREQVTFESIHRRKDGSTYPVEVRANLLANETPPAFVEVIQDITEPVAANEERARLASAVEQTADAVWMQDVDGIVTYVNRSFSRLYGYEPDEIVGRYAGIVDSGRHEPAFFDAIWASVAAGKTWTGPIVNRRKDGTLLEVEAVISGIRDADGRLVSYMQTDRDVTRERALENALEREARERETIEAGARPDRPGRHARGDRRHGLRRDRPAPGGRLGLGDRALGRPRAGPGRCGPDRTRACGGSLVPSMPGAPPSRTGLDRAWAEVWQARPEDGTYGEAISASGLHTAVFAPLKGPRASSG